MIGYLKGRVIEKSSQEVFLNVRDVGYRLRVGVNVLVKLVVGEEVELFVHTQVREDALELYGFETRQQLVMFEVMISVSGIGPKTGLGIVGGAQVEHIEKAVRDADVGFFTQFSGVGKKGAQRIMVDLKGKLPRMKELDLADEGREDMVYQALLGFGFGRAEIGAVLTQLNGVASEEEKIREALKLLGRR